jgi:hypothetical protein
MPATIEHVTDSLDSLVEQEKVANAYLKWPYKQLKED